MTEQHPITPPPELVQQWFLSAKAMPIDQWVTDVATAAARWGADQQLEKDAKWLDHNALSESHLKVIPVGDSLKEAMRPKPPSLKQQALNELRQISINPEAGVGPTALDTIRRALEALPE